MKLRPVHVVALTIFLAASSLTGQASPERMMVLEEVLQGTEEVELRWPVAVATVLEDRIAIADAYKPRVLLFRQVGVSWTAERAVELPGSPVGMIWDGARLVISLRQPGGLLELRPPDFKPSELALSSSVVPGPLAVTSGGELILFDASISSVLRLSSSGDVVTRTAVQGIVTGLEALVSGGFLAAIGDQARVEKFDSTGQLTDSWNLPSEGSVPAWPAGIVAGESGRTFVADRHNGRILLLDSNGEWIGVGSRSGWEQGLLRYPNELSRLPGDRLVVSDQGNGRAQIFLITSATHSQ